MRALRIAAVLAATVGVLVLAGCGSSDESSRSLTFGFGPAQGASPQGVASEEVAQTVEIEILPAAQEETNEATMPANFAVMPNAPVKVVIDNYTDEVHTFTAPKLNVNRVIPPGSPDSPTVTTFTFTPESGGVFEWTCVHCGTHMGGKIYAIVTYAPRLPTS